MCVCGTIHELASASPTPAAAARLTAAAAAPRRTHTPRARTTTPPAVARHRRLRRRQRGVQRPAGITLPLSAREEWRRLGMRGFVAAWRGYLSGRARPQARMVARKTSTRCICHKPRSLCVHAQLLATRITTQKRRRRPCPLAALGDDLRERLTLRKAPRALGERSSPGRERCYLGGMSDVRVKLRGSA